jgi:hypothetical protein
MTVADLGKKVDALGDRLDARIDSVDMKIDAVASDLGAKIAEHEKSNEQHFAAIQFTFGEMRSFVTESIGSLRADMLVRFERVDQRFDGIDQRFDGIDQRFDVIAQRFDRMDRRFDRIEDKLDRALSHRPSAPRRRRKQ